MAKEAQINLSFQGAGRFLQPGVKVLMWDNVRGEDAWTEVHPDPTNQERYFAIYTSPKLYIHDHRSSKKIADWDWVDYLGNDWMWTSMPEIKTFGIWNKGVKDNEFSVSYAHWNYREDAYDSGGSMKSILAYFRIEGGKEGFQDEVLYKEPPWLPQGAYEADTEPGWYESRFHLYFNYCGRNLHWTGDQSWQSGREANDGSVARDRYRSVEMYVDENGVTEYNWWETPTPSPIGDLSNTDRDDLLLTDYENIERKGVIFLNHSESDERHLYWQDNQIYFGEEVLVAKEKIDSVLSGTNSKEKQGLYRIRRISPQRSGVWNTIPWSNDWFWGMWLGESWETGSDQIGYADYPEYTIWNWTTLHGDSLYVTMFPELSIFSTSIVNEIPEWLNYSAENLKQSSKKIHKVWVYKYSVTDYQQLIDFGFLDYIADRYFRDYDEEPYKTEIQKIKEYRWKEFDVFAPGGAGIGLPCAAGLYIPG